MRSSYKRIGQFVRQVNNRNTELAVINLKGININKQFMPSVANINGTDLSSYKVVLKNQFAYNPMHVGRDEILPIGMLESDNPVIVSPAYVVFEIIDPAALLPEYLMMWCSRPEFDRNAWFTTDSSVRGGFNWDDFCDMTLPVPHPDKQREIIREYSTIVERIKLNEQLNQKLEETAQTLYKQWFVDFEFPISKEYAESIGKLEFEGKPYKTSGGEMVYCEKLGEDCPKNWTTESLGQVINYKKGNAFKSDEYSMSGIPVIKVSNFNGRSIDLTGCSYISENLAKTYSAYKLNEQDILVSTVGSWPDNPNSVVGLVVSVPAHANETLLNQNVVRLRAKNALIQAHLYLELISSRFSEYLVSGAQGSANQASVTLDHIFDFNILFSEPTIENKFCNLLNKLNSVKHVKEKELLYLKQLKIMTLARIVVKGN